VFLIFPNCRDDASVGILQIDDGFAARFLANGLYPTARILGCKKLKKLIAVDWLSIRDSLEIPRFPRSLPCLITTFSVEYAFLRTVSSDNKSSLKRRWSKAGKELARWIGSAQMSRIGR
jgi:hypothetical protein